MAESIGSMESRLGDHCQQMKHDKTRLERELEEYEETMAGDIEVLTERLAKHPRTKGVRMQKEQLCTQLREGVDARLREIKRKQLIIVNSPETSRYSIKLANGQKDILSTQHRATEDAQRDASVSTSSLSSAPTLIESAMVLDTAFVAKPGQASLGPAPSAMLEILNRFKSIIRIEDGGFAELRCVFCGGNAVRNQGNSLRFLSGMIGLHFHLVRAHPQVNHRPDFQNQRKSIRKDWILDHCIHRNLTAAELEAPRFEIPYVLCQKDSEEANVKCAGDETMKRAAEIQNTGAPEPKLARHTTAVISMPTDSEDED